MAEKKYIRVYYKDVEDKMEVEEILCKKLSNSTYQLLEIPLWADSLALGDTIYATDEGYADWCAFEKFCTFSGNSTLQIVEIAKNGIKKYYQQ